MQALSLLRRAEILTGLGFSDAAMENATRAIAIAENHNEKGLSRTANLWIVVQRAQRGFAEALDVRQALAEVTIAGNVRSGFTRAIMERAETWLCNVHESQS